MLMNTHQIRIRGQLVEFEAASTAQGAHAVIRFASNQKMRAMGFPNLSAANVSGPRPRNVYINSQNFYTPPRHWSNPNSYREYVVAHEILHSMNANHLPSPGRGRPCPLMFAQTDPSKVHQGGCDVSQRVSRADLRALEDTFDGWA